MERFWKYKIDHLIFWTATVCFHMFTRISLVEKAGVVQFALEILVRNGLLACVIYFNLAVLIPRLAQRRRIFLYVLSLTGSLIVYALTKNIHDVYLNGYILGEHDQQYFFYNTFYNISIALFYVSFSVALHLSHEWYRQRDLIRKIEIEKLNTELDYLKAQINPHFLFNSINTIYFQIDKQNHIARETLSSFSEMLRYQLYECNGKKVAIEKEISYLRNYVDLQRMRKDENYVVTFSASSDLHGFTIAPLLLIPFVENAFKHVSHFPSENEIRISLSRMDGLFRFHIFNTCDLNPGPRKGGIGLPNVQRRLHLLYNGSHTLIFKEVPGSFDVNLTIKV